MFEGVLQPIISFHVWKEFLRVDENRRERFKFLAESTSSLEVEKRVILTYWKQVLTTLPRNEISSLAPCSHEEADTRRLLHVRDALQEGHKKILLRTVDTDVLVLAVALLQQVTAGEDLELWVAFGTVNHLQDISAREIATKLGAQVSRALPVFHAFTGCDTVSCFGGRFMMHKCLKGLSASYLSHKFSTRAIVHDRHTWYRDSLNTLSCRINAGQRAFCYHGVKIWNNLSKDLREIINTKVFKRRLINELICDMN